MKIGTLTSPQPATHSVEHGLSRAFPSLRLLTKAYVRRFSPTAFFTSSTMSRRISGSSFHNPGVRFRSFLRGFLGHLERRQKPQDRIL